MDKSNEQANPGDGFATTRWSMVVAAGGLESPAAQDALAALCQAYWPPLYAYARRRGHSREEAQDLAQEFFCRLLEKNYVQRADKARGRFRSFLLTAFKHFMANEWDRARAKKRGGGAYIISYDFATAEAHWLQEAADQDTPETSYEKQWALRVLDEALVRLRQAYQDAGKERLLDRLEMCLTGIPPGMSHKELASSLGMSEGATRTAVHRLRKKYQATLRLTVAETLTDPGSVDDELRHLIEVIAR